MSGDNFYGEIDASEDAESLDRPGQPTIGTLVAGKLGAHEADVVVQAVVSNRYTLQGPQFGVHAAHALLTLSRLGYSYESQQNLGEPDCDGSVGGIKATRRTSRVGYQARGVDPLDGPGAPSAPDEPRQAAGDIAPTPKADR